MNKSVYVIIRYSVLLEKSNVWELGRSSEDFEAYKRELFDLSRLESRYQLFSRITVPALINQDAVPSDVNYRILVVTSEELPDQSMQKLRALAAKYDQLSIVPVSPSFGNFKDVILDQIAVDYGADCEGPVNVATVRVDDDDAVCRDYVKRLAPYIAKQYSGFAVSFGDGYAAVYSEDTGRFESVRHYYYPKLAIGLAHINQVYPKTKSFLHKPNHVYALGKHSNCDKRCPVILDSSRKSYVRLIHSTSDTSKNWMKEIKKYEPVNDWAEVKRDFSIDESLFG